jgi:hypothetical protein
MVMERQQAFNIWQRIKSMKHTTSDKSFKTRERNGDETKEVKNKLLRM